MDEAIHQSEQDTAENAPLGPFAELITVRIREHAATYRSLEDASGITDGSWANWHRGGLPNKSLIPAAAKALGIDEEALRTLISAERSRRRAGIPIDTTEAARAWIAQQPAGDPVVTAEDATKAAFAAADAADLAIAAATTTDSKAAAERTATAAYATADAAANALASATKAKAEAAKAEAVVALDQAIDCQIDADRASRHAGIRAEAIPASVPGEGG